MRGFANQLRTKGAVIGVGVGVAIAISAITIWNWKSSSPSQKHTKSSDDRSCKTKKESLAKKQDDMVVEQSQSKKDVDQQVKEEEVIVSVETVVEKKTEDLEKKADEGIIETHGDAPTSVKSHTDETEIATIEREANTAATDATNNVEKVNLDLTEESVKVTSPINRDTVSARTLDSDTDIVTTTGAQQEIILPATIIESSEQHKANTVTESSTPDHINDPEKVALPLIDRDIVTTSTLTLDSAEIIATAIDTESESDEQQQESITAATVIGSQQQQQQQQQEHEEYVVIEHPTEKAPVNEQTTVTPVIAINTDLPEKVQVPSKKDSIAQFSSLTATAPEFIPKSLQQPKKPSKKLLTREQLIEQQKQHHQTKSKCRCNHWPNCTNNNCKFFHPINPCRAGDDCLFAKQCMFIHPNDLTPNVRDYNKNAAIATTAAASSSA